MESQIKEKISVLIQLANIDGDFDIKEKAFIYNVSLRHGVDLDTIGDLIETPLPISDLKHLKAETRTEYLTECLLLMMVDGKVLPKEIQYCVTIGEHLGYKKEAIEKLINELLEQLNISHQDLAKKVAALNN